MTSIHQFGPFRVSSFSVSEEASITDEFLSIINILMPANFLGLKVAYNVYLFASSLLSPAPWHNP